MTPWRIFWGLLALLLAGCAALPAAGEEGPAGEQVEAEPQEQVSQVPEQASTEPPAPQVVVELENFGPAPELRNDVWLNVEEPLRLADLRGQVVLLDMWTFGCINCKNVIPSLREWHQTYGDQGLVVIGNHYPEFNYEEDLENLKEAIVRLDVPYAVAQDNDGKTWRAYNNRYWPTLYLIDKSGQIRYRHIGEGRYDETEAAIQALLAEPYP